MHEENDEKKRQAELVKSLTKEISRALHVYKHELGNIMQRIPCWETEK